MGDKQRKGKGAAVVDGHATLRKATAEPPERILFVELFIYLFIYTELIRQSLKITAINEAI